MVATGVGFAPERRDQVASSDDRIGPIYPTAQAAACRQQVVSVCDADAVVDER